LDSGSVHLRASVETSDSLLQVNKFTERFAGLSMGSVAAMRPGDKKLDYKPPSKQKKKGGKK
jgi:hypothetical protein